MRSSLLRISIGLNIVLLLVVIARLAFAWTNPTQSPPNGNVSLPSAQWTASGTAIYNSNSGNVGVGTSNPAGLLDIETSNSDGLIEIGRLRIRNRASGFSPGRQVIHTILDENLSLGASTDTTSTEHLTIKSNGNVGIGTTNPGVKLEVNGDISAATTSATNVTTNEIKINSIRLWRKGGGPTQSCDTNCASDDNATCLAAELTNGTRVDCSTSNGSSMVCLCAQIL